ncbi:MAG TPA: Na/Pi cotransporter family protein, partial [candidate division Zixibacteria bacterium]|nr:Na/Pi cotransporter family protein [candidate division Zixibacteria bacterium]
DIVDNLQEAITDFLTQINMDELDEDTASLSVALLHITFELEHIGDVISKDLAQHVRKKIEVGYYFSDEGFAEILEYHKKVQANLRVALDAIPLRDKKLASQVIEETKHLVQLQRQLYRSHLTRLRKGLKESEETSTLHIDIISDLNKINLHTSYIAYAIIGKV